jgi:hypothetical protein
LSLDRTGAAFLTAVTRVDSWGVLEAAVATGSWARASRLPASLPLQAAPSSAIPRTPTTAARRARRRRNIAYQVLGEGPPDLVMTTGSFGHLDMAWEDPGIALFLRTLASFSRLIMFDRRGTGASDPLPLDSLPHGRRTPRTWLLSWTRLARSRRPCTGTTSQSGSQATLIELPGTELSLFWETPELALDHVERFITGVRRIAQPTRLLATVLFTDIVGSTQRWGAGRPALAGAAERARRADRPAGRGVRRPAWSRGPATASWPPSTGPVGRSTVRDLVAGSDVTLEDRGMYLLKGIDGDWQLLAVARP